MSPGPGGFNTWAQGKAPISGPFIPFEVFIYFNYYKPTFDNST